MIIWNCSIGIFLSFYIHWYLNGYIWIPIWILEWERWRRFDSISNIKVRVLWKHFPRYWPFARVIHRWPVNSPHKGQWRGALMFSLICAWINSWVNNGEAGDLIRHCAHYDVAVMITKQYVGLCNSVLQCDTSKLTIFQRHHYSDVIVGGRGSVSNRRRFDC